MNVNDQDFKELLEQYPQITVYGLSPDGKKPSYYVPEFIRGRGWDIVGVYPREHSEGGFKIYNSLADVPASYRKFINVFRSSDKIDAFVDEILALGGVEVIWLQLGVSNPAAEARAEKAGIKVVSNRCLIIEYRKWHPQLKD